MLFKLPIAQRLAQKKETSNLNDTLYPIYFVVMGFIFGGVLMLSALNNFLFFKWLTVSMAIVLGLMTIHLIGNQQTKKYKS
ncbi:hypothetical protein [Croceitalea rosinachiae]|uniref:Uncharacterized protein n=1 Tax=Croceitalea rosinachiae TaxID=3075596 RepID=A0ABU3A8W2_9FLAO|nr:hypothetical protein [Croceitalea sp. F388]MDT0606623.1 hypothetical protein [Croceitalea sp. F388]